MDVAPWIKKASELGNVLILISNLPDILFEMPSLRQDGECLNIWY